MVLRRILYEEMRRVIDIDHVCTWQIRTPSEVVGVILNVNKAVKLFVVRCGGERRPRHLFTAELNRLLPKHTSFFKVVVDSAFDLVLKLVPSSKRAAMAASLLDELDTGRNQLFPSYPLNEDHIDKFVDYITKEYKRTLMMNEPISSYMCDKQLLSTTLEVLAQFKNSLLYRVDDDSDERPTKRMRV